CLPTYRPRHPPNINYPTSGIRHGGSAFLALFFLILDFCYNAAAIKSNELDPRFGGNKKAPAGGDQGFI
ncbi:MAG: hypothetical protein ACYSR6_11795, partial [Planctomycetota bacterium]